LDPERDKENELLELKYVDGTFYLVQATHVKID
jgi:hypothetical protein